MYLLVPKMGDMKMKDNLEESDFKTCEDGELDMFDIKDDKACYQYLSGWYLVKKDGVSIEFDPLHPPLPKRQAYKLKPESKNKLIDLAFYDGLSGYNLDDVKIMKYILDLQERRQIKSAVQITTWDVKADAVEDVDLFVRGFESWMESRTSPFLDTTEIHELVLDNLRSRVMSVKSSDQIAFDRLSMRLYNANEILSTIPSAMSARECRIMLAVMEP